MSSAGRVSMRSDAEVLRNFLLPTEEYWTAVTARVYPRGKAHFPANPREIRIIEEGSGISGIVYNNDKGYTFPAFRYPEAIKQKAALQQLVRELPRVYTILGDTRIVNICAATRKKKPDYRVDYLLMARRPFSSPLEPASSLPEERIELMDISRAREVYPLQKAYEIEEVLLEPARFNPLICTAHLKKALGEQTIFAAGIGKNLVSKAGTNALGVNWAQIGGVFTQPSLRGRGIARRVLIRLLQHLEKQNKGASLFVKPGNIPACALYRSLGFSELHPFTIVYYLR